MPALVFARYREIAEEIATRLAAQSEEQIIVSSAGLAASATAALLRMGGQSAVSIRLSTLDSFARSVLNAGGHYPRPATDAERRLAMRAAIAGIDDPMMETRGIVSMLERSYRDIRDSGLTLDEFESRSKRLSSLRNRARTEMLLQVWRVYEQRIEQLQAVDSADLLILAAKQIEEGSVDLPPQLIAGFYDMTGAQLQLLHALQRIGKISAILVPTGEGEAYAFAARFVAGLSGNWESATGSHLLHIRVPETRVAQYDSKESELRAVCGATRDLLDGGGTADRIGITARALDPDDIRLLQRFAGELGFRISASLDISLLAHRLGRGLAAILRLREKNFPRGEVIDILRDGYQPRKHVGVDAMDIATRKARVSGGRAADLRNPDAVPALDDYRNVVSELETVAPVSRTLLGVGWASLLTHIAGRFRLESESDLAAAASIDDLTSLLNRWKHQVDIQGVLELLEQFALPRQPTTDNRQPVVWAGDVMKFRGRAFDHLFVIRAQEGALPQRRIDDPLLPDSDRRQLGIREIGDGRDEERLLFQLLLDGAGAVHFSLACSDTFGKILRPSRLLKPYGAPELRSAPDARTTRQPDNLQRQLQLMARSGTQSVFDGYLFAQGDDNRIGALIANALQAISPTQLEDFGECPQKFLLKHLLGVRDYDDPDRELQMHPREKGKLDHTILERFYKSVDVLPPPDLRERIDAIIEAAFDEEEARVPAFNRVMRHIERKATKRNLYAFLADDIADLLASDLRPKHFEYKFGPKYAKRGAVDHPEPFVITTHDVAIRVEGSIDRIDEGPNSMRIVDYKSGKALRHVQLAEKIDRGVRLQLALYAMAVAEFFGRPAISGAIKPLIVRDTDPKKLRFQLSESEPRLRETLDLFVKSMLRGAFPAFPNDEDKEKNFNACKYCPVNHSCRTRHSDAERRIVLPQKDPRTLLEAMP